jgi:hypothetical protein
MEALRRRLAAVAFAVATLSAGAAQATLIVNGGFETGNFTGWTLSGNTGFTGVECPGPGSVPEGSCDAFLGPVGSNGTLSQVVNTQVGADYHISFAFESDGGTPSDFSASFGGVLLTSLLNPAATPYTQLNFFAAATATTTTLTFNFRDDPGFLHLDNLNVSVPEPSTLALFGAGLAGLAALRRRRKAKA